METYEGCTSMAANAPGVIDKSSVYTLAEFKARTGLKDWALRQARKAGLVVRRTSANGGGPTFILGSDWFRFLESRTSDS